MSKEFEKYLKHVELENLLEKLNAENPKSFATTVQHFTLTEGKRRDKIVMNYFGQRGIDQLVSCITKSLLASPSLPAKARILDVGAGSGFFTIRIAEKTWSQIPRSDFYAMDVTPALLKSLVNKRSEITPFVGIAENIRGSLLEAPKVFKIPNRFDAVFSTLMLHHSVRPEKVFENIGNVLKKDGKAVIVDLCEHTFEEFRVEMGDIHLGFKPEKIRNMARKCFSTVKVEKLPGICCESSGRSAEVFVASMRNPS